MSRWKLWMPLARRSGTASRQPSCAFYWTLLRGQIAKSTQVSTARLTSRRLNEVLAVIRAVLGEHTNSASEMSAGKVENIEQPITN
jgi:hypothetical protein